MSRTVTKKLAKVKAGTLYVGVDLALEPAEGRQGLYVRGTPGAPVANMGMVHFVLYGVEEVVDKLEHTSG